MDEDGSGRMNLDEVSLNYSLILYPESNRSGRRSEMTRRLFRPPRAPPRSSFARLLPKGRKNSGGEEITPNADGTDQK